ncbi:MAG: translation initiation factor [Verrucomicrobiota bacterium]
MAKKIKIDAQKSPDGLHNPFVFLDSSDLPPASFVENPEMVCPTPKPASKSLGRVVLRRETAHRGGKIVVVVGDFPPEISQGKIDILGRALRKFCSCGGAVKEREIEIQGEQVSKIREFLTREGFRVVGVT